MAEMALTKRFVPVGKRKGAPHRDMPKDADAAEDRKMMRAMMDEAMAKRRGETSIKGKRS